MAVGLAQTRVGVKALMLAEESERKLELKLGSKSDVGSAMPLGVEKDFVLVLGWVWVRGGLLGLLVRLGLAVVLYW